MDRPLDRKEIEKDWKERGFSCGLWVDPPGQVWEDFTHQSDELIVVIEGDVEVELEGQTVRPVPGEEILVPKGALHSVRNLGSTRSRWLYGYNGPQ